MKKFVLALIITGSALLVTGGALVAVGYATGQSVKVETAEYKELGTFENFNINLRVADLEIKPSTDGTRSVIVDETKYDQHTVEVKDNTLVVTGHDKRQWFEHLFSWAFFQKVKVTVYIPEGTYNTFKVRNSTGTVVVHANYTFDSFDVKTSTGSINSSANSLNQIKAESSTGSINIKDVTAKSVNLKASTGSVHLTNAVVTEDVEAYASTGSVNLENVKCENFKTDGSSGTARLTNVIVNDKIDIRRSTGSVKLVDSDANSLYIKTSTGSVNLTLLSEKVFYATSGTGSVSVPKSTTGGMCEIHSSTGSIKAVIKSAA